MKIISGEYGGRTLKTTVGPGYRPAMAKVRKALFSMLEARGVHWSECRVLDLFAGSGSCGFEALSRGAAEGWFVESNPAAVKVIRSNAELLKVEAARWQVFHVVFIDPPYGKNFVSPAATALLRNRWLAPEAMIVAEAEAAVSELPEVDSRLELLVNRTYGQTRILIWGQLTEK
jgi:16S rRNA (guanine966-N2)-methyltransferase